MTVGELFYGAEKSGYSLRNKEKLEQFFLSLTVLYADLEIMKIFGSLKSVLKGDRLLLPDADILIAATCLSQCDSLATGNVKHFQRFKNLKLLNWIIP